MKIEVMLTLGQRRLLPVHLIAICFLPAVLGAVILTPQNDSTVPYNSNEIYTYDCETDSSGQLFWAIDDPEGNLNAQLQLQTLKDLYANRYGIIVEDQPSFPNRTRLNFNVTRFSQSTFRQDHGSTVVLECRTIKSRGPTQSIFVYGPLDTPSDLVFSALSETHLNLSWTGTDVPRGVQVINRVQVTNLSSGVTQEFNTTDGYVTFDETGECSEFNLTVMSSNELVGESGMEFTLQNIPISPDVSPISESLTTRVDLEDDITIMIMFRPANVCNPENFPVENYTVVLDETRDKLPTSNFDDNQIQAVINDTVIPGLLKDQAINYYVEVCSNVTCRTTGTSTAYTTGVQLPTVYYIRQQNHVLIVCDFAVGSTASGCSFNFTFATADGEVDSELYNVSKDSKENSTLCNGGSQACMCINGTGHFVESYSTIEAFTLEEDGVTRSRISVRVDEQDVSDNPEMIAVCNPNPADVGTLDPKDNQNDIAPIIGGVVGGVSVIIIVIISVSVLIVVCVYIKKPRDLERNDLEEIGECVPVEGIEKTSPAQQPPPPAAPPLAPSSRQVGALQGFSSAPPPGQLEAQISKPESDGTFESDIEMATVSPSQSSQVKTTEPVDDGQFQTYEIKIKVKARNLEEIDAKHFKVYYRKSGNKEEKRPLLEVEM